MPDLAEKLKPRAVSGSNAPAITTSIILRGALSAVCLIYLLQMWSPLRLNGDSAELLSIASSAADGHGFRYQGEKTRYPPGYPAMIAALDRLGQARPWSLIGLNAAFLALALTCSNYIVRNYFRLQGDWGTAVLLFTALSFALIKHFTLPLTDIPFFGTSLAAVALTVKAESESESKYYAFWIAALATSIASVLIRPTAIALFPCLAWSIGRQLGVGRILLRNKKILMTTAAAIVTLVCIAAILLSRTIYVRGALLVFAHQGTARALRLTVRYRLQEIGELCLNAPASRLGRLAPLIWIAGAAGIAAVGSYLRRCSLGTVEVYIAAYLFIILIWPYGDARFWVPVLPLILAGLFSVAQPWRFTGWKRQAGLAYSSGYAVMGLAALAYSSWITFSGANFPRRYGDGNLRPTYEFFYSHATTAPAKIDASVLAALNRYASPRVD